MKGRQATDEQTVVIEGANQVQVRRVSHAEGRRRQNKGKSEWEITLVSL